MDWIQLAQWGIYLAAAVFVLVRGADTFVTGAKHVGRAAGMTAFATGVIIAGFGTSFPELASSIAAVMQDTTEIVIANAVGSNITNILLVVGFVVFFGGRVVIKRDLIKSELPIFFIATVHFVAVMYDGVVDRVESLLLVGTFVAYIWYLFNEAENTDQVDLQNDGGRRPRLEPKYLAYVILGLAGVVIGAHYSIQMVINIATSFEIPVGVISITAIALGTSLPELFVAMKAVKEGHGEFAIGSIFGSNAFNILMVVGLPGLFVALEVGDVVLNLGMGVLIAASLIFFVTGLAKQIMRWEALMMLFFFAFWRVRIVTVKTALAFTACIPFLDHAMDEFMVDEDIAISIVFGKGR